jgi:hypothetical protein
MRRKVRTSRPAVHPSIVGDRLPAASRIVIAIAFAVFVIVATLACGGGSNSTSKAGAVNSDLRVAIRFLPSAANASYTFEFADWGPIEQRLGYSASRLAARQTDAAFTAKLDRLSGGSPAGNVSFDLQPKSVGNIWSMGDVLWDAEEFPIHADAPLAITAFRDGSSISHAEHHLARCRFRSRPVGGLTLYSATRDAALRCVTPLGAGIPYPFVIYAFDADDKLVLQSASPTAVTAAIANHRRHGSNPALNAVLGNLGNVTQVAVAIGPQFCSQLSNPAFLAGRNATATTIVRAQHTFPDATPYRGFGFGYQYASGGVSGRLVFVYPSAAVARSDLKRRERMLRNGIAFSIDEPYRNLFVAGSGHTHGPAAIYQLSQPGTSALRLGTVFDHNDIGFARC